MFATLDVPYVDTAATDLVWTLDHPVVPALAMTTIELPPGRTQLELRVLGASHQVVFRDSATCIVETVACLPGRRPHLPDALERRAGGRHYRFRARVDHVSAAEISACVDRLRRTAQDGDAEERAVVAAFPSDPGAVTALRSGSADTGVAWDTWHVYPRSGQIVTTATVLI